MSYLVFFKDLYLVTFSVEIKFENFKKSPKKHQQGGILQDSYYMKYSSKILKRRTVSKNKILFHFNDLFGGVTKLEAFEYCFVTKLYPPKPSPFFQN